MGLQCLFQYVIGRIGRDGHIWTPHNSEECCSIAYIPLLLARRCCTKSLFSNMPKPNYGFIIYFFFWNFQFFRKSGFLAANLE